MKNIAKVYGDAAGQQLTTLLKDHISMAVDLIKAAKAGHKGGQQKADSRWQRNAEQIADSQQGQSQLAEGDARCPDESFARGSPASRLNIDGQADRLRRPSGSRCVM